MSPVVMTQADVRDLVAGQLLPAFIRERERLDVVDAWWRGKNPNPWMPRGANTEYRALQERSFAPWLRLVVNAVAQTLYVEGYRSLQSTEEAPAWLTWQRNGMDARQIAVHRGAIAHGTSYVMVLPGTDGPVMRGMSARKAMAFYADEAEDDWPMFCLRGEAQDRLWRLRVYDEVAEYHLTADSTGGDVTYLEHREHGLGVCPVVRYCSDLDLDGRVQGEVEPYIPIAARIDQDTFDRLMVQKFSSWIVRTIAGMTQPESNEDATRRKLQLRQDDILIAEDPDTKFGSLPATPLDGYIAARDSDIRDLAATSQTPPHHLLGLPSNLSAEALAAAEAGLNRKSETLKHLMGESHEQSLRLAALVAGDPAGAGDVTAQVRWRDMESRSLAQVADALGKLAEQLQLPPEILWEKIPGLTQQDIEAAKAARSAGDPLGRLAETLDRQVGDPGAGIA